RPPDASPSIVVTSRSRTITPSIMHASTRRPSTCTVHAPHSPRSQPFFVPVRPRRSRNVSSSVARTSSTSPSTSPLTRSATSVPPVTAIPEPLPNPAYPAPRLYSLTTVDVRLVTAHRSGITTDGAGSGSSTDH